MLTLYIGLSLFRSLSFWSGGPFRASFVHQIRWMVMEKCGNRLKGRSTKFNKYKKNLQLVSRMHCDCVHWIGGRGALVWFACFTWFRRANCIVAKECLCHVILEHWLWNNGEMLIALHILAYSFGAFFLLFSPCGSLLFGFCVMRPVEPHIICKHFSTGLFSIMLNRQRAFKWTELNLCGSWWCSHPLSKYSVI